MEEDVKVTLYGLVPDPVSKSPVLVLKSEKGEELFPIWIGANEADVINMELENVKSPRPMTHDLIGSIIYSFRGNIEKVVISDMEESTFYAKLFLKSNGEIKEIDCRPSDAITIALKNKTSIFLSKNVYNAYTHSDSKIGLFKSVETIEKWLSNINIED